MPSQKLVGAMDFRREALDARDNWSAVAQGLPAAG